jgi:serine/threonine-protein kinase
MVPALLNHRYRMLQKLGEGGFGQTFLAEDTQMPSKRRCVIKQLKPLANNPQVYQIVQERFQREAAILETLGRGSDQIPDLYAYFIEAGEFYLIQEWIAGPTLVEKFKAEGVLSEPEIWDILCAVLPVLDYVHNCKMIHRDIKPDNIILRQRDSKPVLIDFGAVKEVASTVMNSHGQTTSSILIGTPGYMPSEQAAGRPLFSSDLYSLGLTMIYLLTGQQPADLETDPRTGEIIWRNQVTRISPKLAEVLDKAIQYHPRDRFATAREMLAALQPAPTTIASPLTSLPTVASAPNPVPSTVFSSNPQTFLQPPQPAAATAIAATDVPTPAPPFSPSRLQGVLIGLGATVLFSGGAFWILRPQVYYNLGLANYHRGNLPAAIAHFNQAIQLQSDYLAAYYQRGLVQAELGKWQPAIADFSEVIELDTQHLDAYLKRAETYTEVGNYTEAIADASEVIRLNAKHAEAYNRRGYTRSYVGQYQAAISDFNDAIQFKAENAEPYRHRGDVRSEIGQYENAIADYKRAIQINPNYGKAHIGLAAVYHLQGNIRRAKQSVEQAVKVEPQMIAAYTNRGTLRADTGDQQGARQDWNQALKLPSRTAEEYVERGYARSRLGDKSGAIADYNHALAVNPNLPNAYVQRGQLWNERGDKSKAIADQTKALQINANLVFAYILRGQTRQYQGDQGDQQGALADYTQALSINPNHPSALNNRCSLWAVFKNWKQALDDCSHGLRVNSQLSFLYNSRGNVYANQRSFKAAVADYTRAIEINAENGNRNANAVVYANRANARTGLNDFQGALTDFSQSLQIRPNVPITYYQRGLLRGRRNDRAGAIADLHKAADLYLQEGRMASYRNALAVIRQLQR